MRHLHVRPRAAGCYFGRGHLAAPGGDHCDAQRGLGQRPQDIYAVGGQGTVLHYDGAAWSVVNVGQVTITSELRGIWGSGPNNLFVVGVGGVILRYGC